MRVPEVVKNTIVVVVAIVGCLVALEVAVRLYSAFLFPRMMVLDDRLGWKHANGVSKAFSNEDGESFLVVQNRYGHRGREYPLQKENGKYRILVLGDSFTEGVHVPETDLFSARLERMNPRFEVLNAGVGGYGTVQEYLYFLTEGARFKPDLLLVMFFENDLSDNCLSYYAGFGPRPYARLKDGKVELVDRLDSRDFLRFTLPVPFRSALNRHSYLYYFLNSYIYQRLFARRMVELQQADLKRIANCGNYEIVDWLAGRMNAMMRAEGREFALVLVPTREDLKAGASKAEEPILRFCKESGLRCLALLDRFVKERGAGARLYFDNDIHWTRAGHRVAADEIGRFITESLGAPGPSRSGGVEGAPATPRLAAGLSERPGSRANSAPATPWSPSESAGSRR